MPSVFGPASLVLTNSAIPTSTFYAKLGINSSIVGATGIFYTANNVFLTATSGDLAIGTTTSNAIHFIVNNGATDAAIISSTGVLTLGTALPFGSGGTGLTSPGASGNVLTSDGTNWVSKVSTGGNSTPTAGGIGYGNGTALAYNTAGTAGQILTSAGTGTPTWTTLNSILIVDTTYIVTVPSGPSFANITVDFQSVSSDTIIINLPAGTTSATINFINLSNKASSGTLFAFSVILSHITALTSSTSVTWYFGTHGISGFLPKWTGNIIPPTTITANAIDIWSFFTYDAGTTLIGSLSMADVRNA